MYVCVLLHWPTSVTIQSLQTLRHNGYLSLGQPAKPQPSLVPAIINITWSHRTIHYLHLCMYAFHWVQGSCCAGIESPRDTKLSPGLCSSLTRKVTHQWGYSGMIPSFPGSPRLGEGRAWEAVTTGQSSLRRLHINTQSSFRHHPGYLVKFWHNTRKSECIKPLPRLQEPPDWLTARAQHYLIRNFI